MEESALYTAPTERPATMNPQYPTGTEPASGTDSSVLTRGGRLALAAALAVAGLGAILAGWFGVSGTRVVTDQLSYLASGSALGLGLIGIAGAVLVVNYQAEQRREIARLTMLVEGLYERLDTPSVLTNGRVRSGARSAVEPDLADSLVVAVPGAQRVHRRDCAMVHGKSGLRRMRIEEARADGLKPCRVCGPDIELVAQ